MNYRHCHIPVYDNRQRKNFTMPVKIRHLFSFLWLLPMLLHAWEVDFSGHKTQGGLVIGRVLPGMQVIYQDRQVRVSDEGYFLLGFGRDAPALAEYEIVFADGRRENKNLTISPRSYKEEIITGLAANQVQPGQAELDRIAREQKYFDQARLIDAPRTGFLKPFIWPVQGRISGQYGSRRILNGTPKRPHYGLDIAAPEGTPVRAPADGVVTMNQPDLFYTGTTIMLDHGHGLSTLYIHLNHSDVTLGQSVKQGEIIGSVGATGRATGPHLHWGMSLFSTRLDPQLMLAE